jgi:hypothetical protein
MSRSSAKYFLFLLFGAGTLAQGQVTCTGTSSDDAFLATGHPVFLRA